MKAQILIIFALITLTLANNDVHFNRLRKLQVSTQCSNHGYYYKEICFCYTSWIGAQCEIQVQPLNQSPPTQWIPTSCYGIYKRDTSTSYSKSEFPFIKGITFQLKWNDFEPENEQYAFSLLEASLKSAFQQNVCWYGMIHVGPDSPDWIYKEGNVTKVNVPNDPLHPGFNDGYPDYRSANYQKLWFRMIQQVANYLRNLPQELSSKVGFWQVTTGCTGDEVAFKQPPIDAQYRFTDDQWDQWRLKQFELFRQIFQEGPGKTIPMLFNNVDLDTNPIVFPWLLSNVTQGFGIKGNAFVRGHHLTGEQSWINQFQKYMLNPQGKDPLVFTRSEMDQSYSCVLFQRNIKLATYWGILSGLNQGLAVHDVSATPLKNAYAWETADSYDFFNKYAPQIFPDTATDAFIALHEGLDGLDYVKFPESLHGQTNGNKIGRLKSICDQYKDQGCQMGDYQAAIVGQVYQRAFQTDYNDAGYDIWRGNYQRWLEQVDADITSQGIFRVGGPINKTTEKYARFARALNHTNPNKTEMFFRFQNGFFSKNKPSIINFHIIWYDGAKGSWQLNYTNKSGAIQIGYNQEALGDQKWKHANFTVTDGSLNHSHPRQSDFSISSKDKTNVVIHMIEISRTIKTV